MDDGRGGVLPMQVGVDDNSFNHGLFWMDGWYGWALCLSAAKCMRCLEVWERCWLDNVGRGVSECLLEAWKVGKAD